MSIINYYKLKCDWCGVKSPELVETSNGLEIPQQWKALRVEDSVELHYCCEKHRIYGLGASTKEMTKDEW